MGRAGAGWVELDAVNVAGIVAEAGSFFFGGGGWELVETSFLSLMCQGN